MSGKLSDNQLEYLIKDSKNRLSTSLDELDTLINTTPRYLVEMYIANHYGNREEIAYQCYHSNRIEGSVVTLSDTDRILSGQTIQNDKYTPKDIHEVAGFINAYKRSMRYMTTSLMEVPIILDLHKALMWYIDKNIAGVYRTGGATIYGKEDFIKFPHPKLIDELLNQAVRKYNAGVMSGHALFEACKFKVNFINIHPFSDGNGRTSRIILNCMLMANGMIPIVIKDNQRIGYKRAMQVGYQCMAQKIPNGYLPLLGIVVDSLISRYTNIQRKSIQMY